MLPQFEGLDHVTLVAFARDVAPALGPTDEATLLEHVRFDRNGIQAEDWNNYPILTMPDVPRVETVLINRPNERALGAGEAAQGPTAAAIANAFAAATGRRIRELPLTPERVKAALA